MAKKKEQVSGNVASPMRPRPTLHLSAEDLPEIKDWKVGGKYRVVVDVEMVRASKGEYEYDQDKRLQAAFRVSKAKAVKQQKDIDEIWDKDNDKE